MMDSAELRVLRRQTTHFIMENPSTVLLYREGARVSDGAGGFTTQPGGTLGPQTFRRILQSDRGEVMQRDVDGTLITPDYVFLGEWDADIQTGDVWKVDGINHKVVWVRDDHRYETWAEVVQRG